MRNKITDDVKRELRKKLLEEKEKIISQLKLFTVKDPGDAGGFRSRMKDDEDTGRKDEDNVQDGALMENKRATEDVLEAHLREVEAALERLDTDEYGLCEECGQPIAVQRLQYNPAADKCMKCAA